DEADRVADVGRPDLEQLVPERALAGPDLRVDVEDQQRRGDREDAVGEGLEPARAHASRSIISVTIVEPSVQSRCGMFGGQCASWPARIVVVSPPTEVNPSPSRQSATITFGLGCAGMVACSVKRSCATKRSSAWSSARD